MRPFGRAAGQCDFACTRQFTKIFKHLVDPEEVAAIIMEPVAGEGGYIVPPVEFVRAVRRVCDEHGIKLIFDEIQTGFGRTGRLFAHEHFGVRPDIMSVAKGIASGFPLSAVIGKRELMEKWPAGAHGGTFGGNPVACAAAVATLDLLQGGLVENARVQGAHLKARLEELKQRYPSLGDVRGLGLMVGAEFVGPGKEPAAELVKKLQAACLERGLILLNCGAYKNVIRFIAPLIVTREQIDQATSIVEEALTAASPA